MINSKSSYIKGIVPELFPSQMIIQGVKIWLTLNLRDTAEKLVAGAAEKFPLLDRGVWSGHNILSLSSSFF